LNLTNEHGRAKQRTASIGVATGVSEAVSEVHHPKKSRQTNKELNSVIQQNANKKIKCIDSDNIKTHRITKTSKPSVATPSPQIAVQKSPNALNVKRQLKFKGNSVTNPYLKTNCYVSPFMSLTKMTTFPAPSSISISPTKVSPLKSPKKKNRTQRNDSLMKSELQSEPVPNKLHAYEIDWIDKNITTAEAKKYPHFTEIKRTQQDILYFLANQFKPCDIKIAFAALIGKLRGCTHKAFYPLPSQKVKLIESFLELVHDENSVIVNTSNQHA
jgi:hypothetical protein